MYIPATAMPLTARQISAGSRPSLSAMPKHDSAFSALLARKIVRADIRSVNATKGSTAAMYPADMIPASQPASALVNDHDTMNCGNRAGTSEKLAKLKTSDTQTHVTALGRGTRCGWLMPLSESILGRCPLPDRLGSSSWGFKSKISPE